MTSACRAVDADLPRSGTGSSCGGRHAPASCFTGPVATLDWSSNHPLSGLERTIPTPSRLDSPFAPSLTHTSAAHTTTLQTQSTTDSRMYRRIRDGLGLQSLLAAPAAACLSDLLTVQRCPSWGISKYWEDYTASCSWWAIFAATARSGEIHSNQLAVQLSTTAQARLRERVEADGHGDRSDIDDLAIEALSKYVSHTHLCRASDCSQSPFNSLHPSSR